MQLGLGRLYEGQSGHTLCSRILWQVWSPKLEKMINNIRIPSIPEVTSQASLKKDVRESCSTD